jgi:agmatine deiminase
VGSWPRLAAQGYRWPAEWEPHRATWLSWPHNAETWPGRLDAVQSVFVEIVRALQGREQVCIQVQGEAMAERVRSQLRSGGVEPDRGVELHPIPTDDAWVRDTGGIVVVRDGPEGRERALVDFGFDAWGGKYEPYDRDAAVARLMARALGLPRHGVDVVLEGGSIDGNGAGVLLTTESCLLHPNRGERTPGNLETMLEEVLGVRQVLWLSGIVAGDDTDGHVDDLARFVQPDLIVAAHEPDPTDPNHAALAENLERLGHASLADGKRPRVAMLPMPRPVIVDGVRCPASYANFYLANGVALVPVFGDDQDARALSILKELLEDRDVVAIPARDLVVGLGAVHCLTQQEPV